MRGLVPTGPPVWICGDCHLGNLGPVANVKGQVEIAIRDFDQTVIGNPAHDLIRLALSLATAARTSDLSGVTTAHALEQMLVGYHEGLSHPHQAFQIPKPLRLILKEATKREWRHLTKDRFQKKELSIPLGKRFWPLWRKEKEEIARLFHTRQVQHLITSLKGRRTTARIRVVDAAYWVKGCSSLGRLRYAVLVRVRDKHKRSRDWCIIDIKEATKAVAPRADRALPSNPAARVVEGASRISPFLGERMLAATFLTRPVFLRELMPQDLKLELDQLTRNEITSVARYLAAILGKAHGRQMETKARAKWWRAISRHRSRRFAAPSWLWKSVVELMANHEKAYLEHCQKCVVI
jgi:uncharacterized protein (DUF2252 family)